MAFRKAIELFCVSALSLLSINSFAEGFDSDYEEKPWVEIEVHLPAFPAKENLIPFQVGVKRDIQYFVDGNSLSVGTDDVIRYTLVIVSSAGAQNISYEGLRCATAERRLYAFGRSDKTWSKARSNQWVKVQGGSNNHSVGLYTNYFCTVGASTIMSAEDARKVLRAGGQPALVGP